MGDPSWAPPPARPFLLEVGTDPGRLRIAFTDKAPTGVEVQPDCVNAVREAAALCAVLGPKVVEATLTVDVEEVTQAFVTVYTADGIWHLEHDALKTGRTVTQEWLETLTWGTYEMVRQYSALAYLEAVATLQRISRDIGRFFQSYDV